MPCNHTTLHLRPSPFAPLAGYSQPSTPQLLAAETKSGKAPRKPIKQSSKTFPAPLVLPHDDLNYDPDYPPQSTRSWLHEKDRNKMTRDNGRDCLYIARVREGGKGVEFMKGWSVPSTGSEDGQQQAGEEKEQVDEEGEECFPSNDEQLLISYLSAFYHDMTVKQLPEKLSWTNWTTASRSKKSSQSTTKTTTSIPKYIGLTSTTTNQTTRIRIRTRPTPFPTQLHLSDLLDCTISLLPLDAYALCLLIPYDMYESADDDFCCGRAYGGSRVAVVQTARYNPKLDKREGIDRVHMWPFSHCREFVDGLCVEEEEGVVTRKGKGQDGDGAMRRAVDSAAGWVGEEGEDDGQALWFSRVARTVSHELGHCFGMDHCVYYACNMQGTAGMREDVRQPPYLCAVCEGKVGHAIAVELNGGGEKKKEVWVRQRCEALREFCGRIEIEGRTNAMWRGLDAWLRERLLEM